MAGRAKPLDVKRCAVVVVVCVDAQVAEIASLTTLRAHESSRLKGALHGPVSANLLLVSSTPRGLPSAFGLGMPLAVEPVALAIGVNIRKATEPVRFNVACLAQSLKSIGPIAIAVEVAR